MKIKMILGLLAALMLAEPVSSIAAPANGVAAHGYSTIATPLVTEAAPGAKVEKAWWVRRYWYRPGWRRWGYYRPYWRRRFFWRRRWFY